MNTEIHSFIHDLHLLFASSFRGKIAVHFEYINSSFSYLAFLSLQLVNKIIIYHTTQGMNLQKPFFIESGYSTFALQYCNTQQKVGILYIKCKCFMMYQINGVFSQ